MTCVEYKVDRAVLDDRQRHHVCMGYPRSQGLYVLPVPGSVKNPHNDKPDKIKKMENVRIQIYQNNFDTLLVCMDMSASRMRTA